MSGSQENVVNNINALACIKVSFQKSVSDFVVHSFEVEVKGFTEDEVKKTFDFVLSKDLFKE